MPRPVKARPSSWLRARTGQPETLKLLLKAGADPNAAERRFGETALMWAAGHDHAEAIRVLVAGGAKPDAISAVINLPKAKVDFSFAVATALPRGGMTALMYAARQGQINAVTALADVGANLNVVDPEGSTAIVIAIINAHYEVAARLAEKGADPNIGDAAGMAALYAAVDMKHPASLTNRPPQVRTGRLSAADLVTVLLKNRADPNVALKAPLLMRQHNAGDASLGAGATPLMRAAKALDLDIMKALLDHRRRSVARSRKRHDHSGRGSHGTGFAHADSRHADVPGRPAAARRAAPTSTPPAQTARRFCIRAWTAAKRSSACSWNTAPSWISRTPAAEPRSISRSAWCPQPRRARSSGGSRRPRRRRGARCCARWSCTCNRRRNHRVLARTGPSCSWWRSPLKHRSDVGRSRPVEYLTPMCIPAST